MLDKNDIEQIKTAINLLGIKSHCQILCDSRKIKKFKIDGKNPHILIIGMFNVKILPILMEKYSTSFVFELEIKSGIIKAAKINPKNGQLYEHAIENINTK